jgi:hypothetical protein
MSPARPAVTVSPFITVHGPGEPLTRRCGYGPADTKDRNHLFLEKIHAPLQEYQKGGDEISSFFVKRSRHLTFFGPLDLTAASWDQTSSVYIAREPSTQTSSLYTAREQIRRMTFSMKRAFTVPMQAAELQIVQENRLNRLQRPQVLRKPLRTKLGRAECRNGSSHSRRAACLHSG